MADLPKEPITRQEEYLSRLAGENTTLPREPITREEMYLEAAIDRVQNVEDEVEELKNNPDVADIVATYADLQAYDTSKLTDKDVIRVLADETHSGDSTYYRFSKQSGTFTYIGESKQYTDFVGTDGTSAGTAGLVPAPAVTDAGKYLKADGTWDSVQAGPTVVQTTGNSQTDVMSQDATTKMAYNGSAVQLGLANMASNPTFGSVAIGNAGKAEGMYSIAISGCGAVTQAAADASIAIGNTASITSSNHYSSIAVGNRATCQSANSIAIGQDAKTTASSSIAIGENTKAQMNGSVAIGRGSKTTRIGEVNIGTDNGTYGYNSTKNRVLGGVYDGQDAHDAVTVGQLDGRILQNAGAPTTATVGTLGQLLEDTTNAKLYQCTAVTGDGGNPEVFTYTWTEVGAGGGGPTVVQTTGTSQTDVMSQDAVTQMVYPGTFTNARNVKLSGGTGSVQGNYNVVLGGFPAVTANYNVAIGDSAFSNKYGCVLLGSNTNTTGGDYAVALGTYSSAWEKGVVSVGDSSGTHSVLYNNTPYRKIVNVYDGQDPHDAATIAQGNRLMTAAPTTSDVGVLGQLWTDTTAMHTYQCTAISGSTYTWTQRW